MSETDRALEYIATAFEIFCFIGDEPYINTEAELQYISKRLEEIAFMVLGEYI